VQRLLFLLLAWSLVGCSGLPLGTQAPKVHVSDVEIKSIGLFEQHFDVGLRVNNPNDFDLSIVALEFELRLNDQPFAQGLTRVSARVPALSSSVIRVDAVTQSKNLIQQFKTLSAEALKSGLPYRITGRVKTDRSSRWLTFDHAGVMGEAEKIPKGRAI